ncbi:hypothetical protein A2U01_0035948, partial [Trifolium medium]|nr:hypothetical protein [Trifolium medium]
QERRESKLGQGERARDQEEARDFIESRNRGGRRATIGNELASSRRFSPD